MDQGIYSKGPIRIGNKAWFGTSVIVLDCVTIGSGAVIGAGSVVTRDVPDYGLVWGNPARLMGFVAPNGERLMEEIRQEGNVIAVAPHYDDEIKIPIEIWEKAG